MTTLEIFRLKVINRQLFSQERLNENPFRELTKISIQEVRDFGDHCTWNDKSSSITTYETGTAAMPGVGAICQCKDGSSVNNNGIYFLFFFQSNSSCRSAMSFRPLDAMPTKESFPFLRRFC